MHTVKYHKEVEKEANDLPIKIKVKYDRIVQKMEWNPHILQKIETKPLRDVLFELRSIRNDLDRGLWVYHKGKIIYILLIFIKNTKNRIWDRKSKIARDTEW